MCTTARCVLSRIGLNFTCHHTNMYTPRHIMQETAAQVVAWRETSTRELEELDAALARLTEVRNGAGVRVFLVTWYGLS